MCKFEVSKFQQTQPLIRRCIDNLWMGNVEDNFMTHSQHESTLSSCFCIAALQKFMYWPSFGVEVQQTVSEKNIYF